MLLFSTLIHGSVSSDCVLFCLTETWIRSTPFFLAAFNSCHFLLLPRLTNSSLPATLTFILIIPQITSHVSYYHFSPLQAQSTREFSHPQQKHILDLGITSSDFSLAPSLSSTHCSASYHFPVFTKLCRHWLFSHWSKILSTYNT